MVSCVQHRVKKLLLLKRTVKLQLQHLALPGRMRGMDQMTFQDVYMPMMEEIRHTSISVQGQPTMLTIQDMLLFAGDPLTRKRKQ